MYQRLHAYISSWYEHENVPTWNYGKASILNVGELKYDLTILLQKYEKLRKQYSLPFGQSYKVKL